MQLDSELRQYPRYFSDEEQRVYEDYRENSRPALKLSKVHEFVAYADQQMLEE